VSATSDDHEHLVSIRTSGTKLPLFLFPNAGVFRDLAPLLPKDRSMYSVDTIDFCENHKNFTIKDLAEFTLQVLRQKQQHGPYYLCGWSWGGFVAYEMAAQLAKDGEEIGLLAIIDAHNPARNSNLSLAGSARTYVTYLGNRLVKYGRNLLRGDLKKFITDARKFVTPKPGKLSWRIVQPVFRAVNRPVPAAFQINNSIIDTACINYVPTPYNKPFVLFKSTEQSWGPEYDNDLTLGWDRCAIGGIDVHVLPGDHLNMLAKPNVFSLSEKLTYLLSDAPAPS
jgi:thioesterase domain-containing protein